MDEPKSNPTTTDRVVFVLAALVLVIKFISSLMPSSESPSAALNGLNIVIELLAAIAVIGLGVRLLRSQATGRSMWALVLAVGLIAGFGLLVINVTGGPRVVLPPRSADSSPALEGLPKQMSELVNSHTELILKLTKTSFGQAIQKDPNQFPSLPRGDIREARDLVGQLRDCVERIQKLLAQAESNKIDVSVAFKSNERVLIRPELWQAEQQLYGAVYEKLNLIDQNWDEWVADPSFSKNKTALKPWQREVTRLNGEIEAARQAAGAIINKPAVTSSSSIPRIGASQSGEKTLDFLDPANFAGLLASIKEKFGPVAQFMEILIHDHAAFVQVPVPDHANEVQEYSCGPEKQWVQFGSPKSSLVQNPKPTDFFSITDIQGFEPRLADLKKKTLDRLQVPDGTITRLTFYRRSPFNRNRRSNKLLLEIRCEGSSRATGWVIYDVSGSVIDVVNP